MTTAQLWADGMVAGEAARTAQIHSRLATPLQAVVAVCLGFAALMTASFSRFGIWRQIGFAIAGLVLVQFLENWSEAKVLETPSHWPLSYLSAAVGLSISALMLAWSARTRCTKSAGSLQQSGPSDQVRAT
jgi:lipopolysaccharide export system permease protein